MANNKYISHFRVKDWRLNLQLTNVYFGFFGNQRGIFQEKNEGILCNKFNES